VVLPKVKYTDASDFQTKSRYVGKHDSYWNIEMYSGITIESHQKLMVFFITFLLFFIVKYDFEER
jgi:hypothetical protein